MLSVYLSMIDSGTMKDRFEEIYSAYSDIVYSAAYDVLHDAHYAEDAALNTFFILARNMEKIADKTSSQVRNFLIVIAKNQAIKIYKKRKKNDFDNNTDQDIQYIADIRDVEADIESKVMQERLFELIQLLDEKYSCVLMMKYFYGLKTDEIARSLGISRSNVKVRLKRAREQLKEKISEGKLYD